MANGMCLKKKKKGVNYLPKDKNYDLYKLALKVTAKRSFPNYVNLDTSFNESKMWKKDDSQRWYYECAILGDGVRIFENRHGEKTSIGRGSLAQIAVDMPKIAIESAIKTQDKLGVNFEIGLGSQASMTEKYKNTFELIRRGLDFGYSSDPSSFLQFSVDTKNKKLYVK